MEALPQQITAVAAGAPHPPANALTTEQQFAFEGVYSPRKGGLPLSTLNMLWRFRTLAWRVCNVREQESYCFVRPPESSQNNLK
jgi:hypothetical protein